MNPPSFEGSMDPLAVEDWLRELERIIKFIRCEDAEKVTFSVFTLKKGASHWFAPHLVDTEEKRARRFKCGLQRYIRDIVQNNCKGKENNAPKKGKTEIVGVGGDKRCPKCDRPHKGECLLAKNVCFKCGKSGHFAKECPQNQTQKAGDDKKGKARVFSLSRQEAERDPNVLVGIVSVSNMPAFILVADQIARNLKMRIDGRGIATGRERVSLCEN
ncbi:uncharacterized protein LOC111404766 [Olea europaea var. sylvestris]|uniref:uncharacterized protein LOC111404766 n=1 Tax=Olea europaea var. sylvestris TaxID=158386 RepID=UPI000C1CD8F8|nr:uncharacterized protein LOC111404766 [Olea europaea var. sylvestris]